MSERIGTGKAPDIFGCTAKTMRKLAEKRPAQLLAATIAVVCCQGFSPALAQDYIVFGDGTQGCGEYIQAVEREKRNPRLGAYVKDPYYLGFTSFANGFLSGANMMGGIFGADKDLGHATSIEGRMLWLENWCRQHPLSSFTDATGHLVGFLKDQKPR